MLAKKETINIRVSKDDKQKLNHAAGFLGTNLSSFIIQSSMEKAREALKHEDRIELSIEDMKKLFTVLESEEPDEKLMQSFKDYKEAISF